MLHKENLRHSDKAGRHSSLFVPLLVLSLIVLIALSNLLNNRWGIPYTDYVVYIAFLLIGVCVYRYKILDYQYSLIGDELIFERVIGKREKLIYRLTIKEVLAFAPVSEKVKYTGKVDQTIKLVVGRHVPNTYILIARHHGEVVKIVFAPSDELIQLIQRRIPEK